MKKSLLNTIVIIATLLMIVACPSPTNSPRPSAGGNSGSSSSVNYTVKHMKQNVSGNGYTEDADARQTLSGRAGASTAAQTRSYAGFTAQTFSQTTIAANGSTVVTINYNRNVHTVSYSATTSGVTAPAAASYRFGAQVTVQFPTGITAWSYNGTTYTATNNTLSMPDSDVVLAEIYTVTASNVAETLQALNDNDTDTPYTLIVSNSTDLAAITQAISSSDVYVSLSLEGCEGLTSLDADLFQGCDNLTSIVIPETITSVGTGVFSDCTNLESVTFAGNVSSSCVATIIEQLSSDGTTTPTVTIGAADTDALESIIDGINATNSNVSLSLENCDGLTSLDAGLFQGCDNLVSITLPDDLETIGNNAFNGCTGLETIAIPETVTSVGTGVFTGCSNLDSVTFAGNIDSEVVTGIIEILPSGTAIEAADMDALDSIIEGISNASSNVSLSLEHCDGLTSLPNNAFEDCTNLTNIVLPSTITSVGSNIFSGCTNLESVALPGTLNRTSIQNVISSLSSNDVDSSYTIEVTNVTTNNQISNINTAINNSGNYVNLSLEHCTGLTSLSDGAFYNCNKVTSISLPNSVTSIEPATFACCTNLQNISLPDSVTSIGSSAFERCSVLHSIEIPSSVTSIDGSAFYGCNALQSIDVSSDSNSFSSNDGVLFNKNKTTLICCPGGKTSITIPSSVTSIGQGAFGYCASLENIVIPDSVTYVGTNVFSGCTNLNSVTLPGTLNQTSIQNVVSSLQANNASNPYSINITGQPQISDIKAAINTSGKYVDLSLEQCTGLTSLQNYAFQNCTNLTSIVIPETITSVGSNLFSGCTNLGTVTFAGNISSSCVATIIGQLSSVGSTTPTATIGAADTDALESIIDGINATNSNVSLSLGNCNGLTSLDDGLFYNCDNLVSIILPTDLESIGNNAFENCQSLETISIPSSVTSIGEFAFDGCESLQYIEIPSSVTSINVAAFCCCESLQSIIIPSSVTYIGNDAFRECYSLESIEIPSSVTSIGQYAFSFCSALQSFEIPASVTSIGHKTFEACISLESITIPASVTSISERAFSYCSSLQTINFQGTAEQWNNVTKGSYWNYNCPSTMQVVCTDGTITP